MKDHKGLIVTILIVVAPIVWFFFRISAIKAENTFTSGDYQDMENSINEISEQYINNATNTETSYNTNTSQSSGEDSYGSRYGSPISKLISDAKINVDSTNVYAEPDEASGVIGSAYKDIPLTVQDYPNGWSWIKIGELSGWVKTEYITKPEDIVSDTTVGSIVGKSAKIIVDTLRVRLTAEIVDNNIIDTLDRGDVVKIIGTNNDDTWVQIQYNNKTGWISGNSKYIDIID